MPVVRRTRATFRRAEFGFLGVVVYTRVQTPRRCGDRRRAGLFVFRRGRSRPFLTSCWIVGIALPSATLALSVLGGFRQKAGPQGPAPGCCPDTPKAPLRALLRVACERGS